MLYREMRKTKEKVSILGFGCMRLPTIDGKIDRKKASEMLSYAIENGVNYLDTAYPYHNGESESFLGEFLKNGYRDKIFLATKLPTWLIKTREDMDKYLDEQLKRLQTDHIDFYLLHGLNEERWDNLKNLKFNEFLESAIADGRIRHTGFSFHDSLEVFKNIVDSYDWSVCQIQYNYLDVDYQAGKEGLKYAAERGLSVIVMSPLRGGKLASSIPNEAMDLFKHLGKSPTYWALRWVWDHPEVSLVLSGMSELSQVIENLQIAKDGLPNSLTSDELHTIDRVMEIYKSKMKISCTSCKYCQPCPNGVNIPFAFQQYNNAFIFDDLKGAKQTYNMFTEPEQRASNCIECGLCETQCPQNLPIIKLLKEVAATFEDN
ncbi:aldo/keto reductase [Kosmotoga pacifica]|uniref:Aldo/keto reductase n=1 Tax=Kosmotoga pacifica TaxID=1330330 RepID=A0A0G2ZD46_9BACT|nr:aldo/keto reductase [Kosmotoga pacifica]AKI97474.1 aldo/keto reductase [Kosmotoga pacifica]